MYKEFPKGAAPELLEKLAGIYRRTDAFVIVTGEYNDSRAAGADESAGSLSGRVFLAAVGDCLLLGGDVRRGESGHAAARGAL